MPLSFEKHLRMSSPLPVTVLTGFLGAGKSTLLNFMLRHPALQGTAVIINEYGDVGVDHHLVETAEEDVTLIAGGCLCCTARGQLGDALLKVFERAQHGRIGLRRVIIETTGLAEPGPILQPLLHDPWVGERYLLDRLVTLVDAAHGMQTLDGQPIAVAQVTAADQILLSKTDLVPAEQADALERRLRQMNPDASLARVIDGKGHPSWLFSTPPPTAQSRRDAPLGLWFDSPTMLPATLSPVSNSVLSRPPPDVDCFSVVIDEPLPPARVYGWLDLLRSLCGPDLLRIKGLIHVTGQPGPLIIHGVQNILHPAEYRPAWPDEDHRSRLVFITRGWAREAITSTLAYLKLPAAPCAEKITPSGQSLP